MHLSEATQREKIPTTVYSGADSACQALAAEIAALIRERAAAGKSAVLGLATGSTPVRLYRELIRLHREDGLSFANVITFNLDEYHGLAPTHPESYRRFMQDQLFDHVDIPADQTHVPDGLAPRDNVFDSCAAYEQAILDAGGIDIQILGIGRTGHIGFNEPGSGPDSRTRLITLDSLTRRDAARDFLGEQNVPRHAITMGVGTILDARRVVLLAWGESKAAVVAEAIEGKPTETLPASFLQRHKNCAFYLDEAAAGHLTRLRHPWLVGPVDWTPGLMRQAVLWLARKVDKPLLKLVDEDYSENGMADLITSHGPAYNLNIDLFNITQHTISGWPGGKPGADDSHRPERALPHPKRALVLSPEPLDDVFCLGGTLHRLSNQGHQLTVAYQTSGNLAVPDTEVRRTIDLLAEVSGETQSKTDEAYASRIAKELAEKNVLSEDSDLIRRLKGLIRRSEARSSARVLGIGTDCLRFLDLPFYEKGRYRRFSPGEEDIQRLTELLRSIKPHQIFATGYQSDPLSIPGLCFQILEQAYARCQDEPWVQDCRVWLYRGPAAEWPTHEIDMAVPLSPDELTNKIQGIYQHQTQRSQTPSTSQKSTREAWTLAEHLNRATAETYDSLGLPEYEAIEAFKRWLPA